MNRYFHKFLLALLLAPSGLAANEHIVPIKPTPNEWRFSNGPEFPGAAGSLHYAGDGRLRLEGDFTRGGGYVSASHTVNVPGANELSFRIRGNIDRIGVRFRDSRGQMHQHFVAVGFDSGNTWVDLSLPVEGSPGSHWGGANDALFRGDVTEIGFAAHKRHFRDLNDFCEIRDVRLSRSTAPPEKPLDFAKFDVRKVTVNGRASIRKEKDALIVEIPGDQAFTWPGVNLRPQNGHYFDLSDGSVLAMDVTNLTDAPIALRCQIENLGANGREFCVKGGRGFYPGETATLRVRYYRNGIAPDDVVFEGVLNPPEGLRGSNNLDVKKITNLMLFRLPPARDIKIAVRNIRVEGPVTPVSDAVKSADAFYPAIDPYGQYKHKEWPGKTHGDADLAAARREEAEDLAANPSPSGWNKFGGWASGPPQEATGHFYPKKHNGKWYLVDPEGRLFFSQGINQFTANETTGLTLRERYFEAIPDKDDPAFKAFWGVSTTAPGNNFYRSRDTRPVVFNFYGRNLLRKYGGDWREIHRKLAHDRARSWGVNTMGNWSWAGYVREGGIPYVIQAYSDGPTIKGHSGAWQHFEDVFDPKFEDSIVSNLSRYWKFAVNDPMCIGIFVDNEHKFGGETSLAEAVLRSPSDQSAKKEFRRRLELQYGDIAKLNAAWEIRYSSWDAFLSEIDILPLSTSAKADLKIFNTALIERYFEGARAAVRRMFPDKLYLGCRFAGVPREELIRAAAGFCDVLSFNLYQYSVAGFKLPEGVDKPVIVGEFHFGTIDGGHSHPGLSACASKEECADAYRFYLRTALRHPNFVGCHYYRLIDEHPAGRTIDNENMGVGFLDICDRPYPEMVKAARDIAKEMYTLRSEK